MYIDKRTLKDGSCYFSFSYLDKTTKKRIRLKKSEHPHFSNRKDAEAWAKSQKAYDQSQKNLIAKKLEWKNQYYDFDVQTKKYAKWQKVQAPNSWENNIIYLEQYVLPWFLTEKKQSNVNGWHFMYAEFCDYLRDDAVTCSTGKKIAVATANKIIHTLNSFTRFLNKYNMIDPDAARKCEAFPDNMQNMKSFDNVIPKAEFDIILKHLASIHQTSADFFQLLYSTGLRANEAFSLPMSFLYSGDMDGTLHDELVEKGISYHGYIVLESQCASKARKRDPQTHVLERKPLKGRKAIHNKNNRLIPIRDKETWNILATRFIRCQESRKKFLHGADPINYLLFPNLTVTRFSKNLKLAYSKTSFTPKTPPECRHRVGTCFVGETRSFFLARAILGHKSNAFERYLHIYEAISLRSKQTKQSIRVI